MLNELIRLYVLNEVDPGRLTVEKVAEMLEITERHHYRLRASTRDGGAQASAHGIRGRPSPQRLGRVAVDADTGLDKRRESFSRRGAVRLDLS